MSKASQDIDTRILRIIEWLQRHHHRIADIARCTIVVGIGEEDDDVDCRLDKVKYKDAA